jgi:AAA domain
MRAPRSWPDLFGEIMDGADLDEPITQLAEAMVLRGMPRYAARSTLEALLQSRKAPRDERWDAWFGEIPQAIESAQKKFGMATSPAISASPFEWCDPKAIPTREWLYGRFLIRRQVSLTVAPGGSGKSSLATVEALAVATGRKLLHDEPWERARVWLWNGEDPKDELQRRIAAACLHCGISSGEIAGCLFVDGGRNSGIVIAKMDRNAVVIAQPVVEALIETIQRNQLDVVVIDPLVSCHQVPENDNGAIDRVVKTYARIADLTGCAIHLVHHSRKTNGEAVEVEHSRGAVALIEAARAARTLNTMTEQEAKNAGVDDRFAHIRIDDGKANLAPRSRRAQWLKLEGVSLGNGLFGTGGDSVAVVTGWSWPNPFAGVTDDDLLAVQKAVAAGRWRENVQARDWVGKPIAEALGLDLGKPADKAKVKGLLRGWIAEGALVVVTDKDQRGAERPFVEVGKWAAG